MAIILLVLSFAAAVIEWLATARKRPKVEMAAKPAVIVFLFAWLYATTKLHGASLWFGLGLLFSLTGDMLLIPIDRFFLPGLIAFALTQVSYIIGFSSVAAAPDYWDVVLAFILLLAAIRILRRLVSSLRSTGMGQLIIPVQVYGFVISLMLFFAMRTLTQTTWRAEASLLVSAGAFLFYISDIILAWNKFISPIRNGPLLNIIAYHLGQIALILGVALQMG